MYRTWSFSVILATFDLELPFCAVAPERKASLAALASVDSGIEPEPASEADASTAADRENRAEPDAIECPRVIVSERSRSETTAEDGREAEGDDDVVIADDDDDDDDDEVIAGIAYGARDDAPSDGDCTAVDFNDDA
ncbi:MAG: hypothetical protein U0103_09685, partial [Candidatus Obscuribacterales bacterium]